MAKTSSNWVYVIEDDEPIVKAYEAKFTFENIRAQFAYDGIEALSKLRESGTDIPAVILLDLMLPGMSGFEILEKLKADSLWKKIPVIILSNLGQEEDKERGLKLGAVEYLVKADTRMADIVSKVRSYVENEKK